jgi:hypothetical protein
MEQRTHSGLGRQDDRSGWTERLHTRMFTDVRSQRAFSHDQVKKIVEIFRVGSRTVGQAVYTGRNRDG